MDLNEAIQHAREVAEGCPAGDRDCAYQHDRLVDLLEELKAYRATGLTPEKIQKFKSVGRWNNTVEQELDKYIQAEKDGRIVVLPPVKVGDIAFFIINGTIYEGKIYYIRWEHHSTFGIQGMMSADGLGGCVGAKLSDFGKKVFLSRKEAETALEEQKKAEKKVSDYV